MLPKHVFLSYASHDADRAAPLVAAIERMGWSVWWDRESLLPGELYRRSIEEAIKASRCVVVLWSRQALVSEWVADEAEAAKKLGILVPVLLEDVDPPLGFRGLEAARLTGWTGQPDHPELALLRTAIAGRIGEPLLRSQAIGDAYFSEQRDIIDEHVRQFVGRTRARQAVDAFLRANERGYFVVRGGPGQGKTAFACQLAKTLRPVHHFVARGTYRADVAQAIRSLIAQTVLEPRRLPEDAPGLFAFFHRQIAGLAARDSRAVLLIDAIDELPIGSSEALDFLVLNPLPRGVFVIVTARAGENLDRLEERIAEVPHLFYDLEPLDDSEVRDLLRAAPRGESLSDAQIAKITAAVAGNPLLLRAVLVDVASGEGFDADRLPTSIEGYFRRATRATGAPDDDRLRRVLGLLAAARRPLSLQELSQITAVPQRELHDGVINPIRAYLLDVQRRYSFYHALFGDFVRRLLLYDDELVRSHQDLARWLSAPDCSAPDYRLTSLAYHLYHARDHAGLTAHIDQAFLSQKVRAVGYAVLEDVELLSRSYLDTGDPHQLSHCLSLVHDLRAVVGNEVVDQAQRLVKGVRSPWATLESATVFPPLPTFPDLELFVALLPRGGASADFVEMVVVHDRLFAIIGDVPGVGINSAFIARFLANLARKRLESAAADLGRTLADIRRTAASNELFESVTMQLVEVSPREGVAAICNAGHPHPVRYSARRRECDRLPVQGPFLNPILDWSFETWTAARHVEFDPGDALVLFTDGLTEAGSWRTEPYGYRFEAVVRDKAAMGATAIGEAILRDWVEYPRQGGIDDVAVVVISRRAPSIYREAANPS